MAAIASSTWISPTNTPSITKSSKKLFLNRIRASSAESDSAGSGNPSVEVSDKVKLALQRAKEYKSKKSTASANSPVQESTKPSLEKSGDFQERKDAITETISRDSLYTEPSEEKSGDFKESRDAIAEAISRGRNEGMKVKSAAIGGQIPQKTGTEKTKPVKSEGLKVSSIDFLGFDFSDKKKGRGIPAGLVPNIDSPFDGDMPEVEILVGDMSKFGPSTSTSLEPNSNSGDENSSLYKPKVSTWGVFPRPKDISKTFGGGKTIRPGDVLQDAEAKAMKEEYTKKMIARYRNEIGLNVDPKIKAECEKAMTEGNQLMDAGRLREALPFYEKVMNSLVYKNELHGLAALQWSICQDSLGRSDKARVMYDKLQSHPSVQVSKKAKHFMFGFQAMEMMKVGSSLTSSTTGYETYFDAFLPEDSNRVTAEAEERDNGAFWQAVPYLLILVSPLFLVLVAAMKKIS